MAFKKGVAANPGGRPRSDMSLRALCRDAAPEAFERLIRVIRADDDGKAIEAAKVIFDRGFGRPAQPVDGDGEGGAIKHHHKVELVIVDPTG